MSQQDCLPITDPDPQPLATVDQFKRRFPELVAESVDPLTIQDVLVEATDHIEDRCQRRLAPFENLLYEDRLFGIDPNEYGDYNDVPLDWQGSLGVSYANSIGASALVRHFWLDQFAPTHPELWTYNIKRITLETTYGSRQPINILGGGILDGPDKTTGHVWLRMGTFAPEGSRISVLYDGGYTVQIPPSLRRACLFQAAKFLVLEAEPQMRSNLNLDELDSQIDTILGSNWIRG